MHYWRAVFFLATLPLWADDPVQRELTLRAQADFDRVTLAAVPDLAAAAACVQSQAAILPVTLPESLSLIHYRQGHCRLAEALIRKDRRGFEDAARSFEQAVAAWPGRSRNKNLPALPAPSGLIALHAISRLEAGAESAEWPDLDRRLEEARRSEACAAGFMSDTLCRQLLNLAEAWRAWIAARQGRNSTAEQAFTAAATPGWADWLAGKRLFRDRRPREAADAFRRALDAWTAEGSRKVAIPGGLNPPGDPSAARIELAGALLAAGDARGALPYLDTAARQAPVRPWTYFLRGRARDEAGQSEAALADFNMAARTALASGEDASGEARFYRGVWLYHRGEFARAEEEFAEALNTGMGETPTKADAEAWMGLSAVASGACDATRRKLAVAIGPALPFFPAAEARRMIARCSAQAPAVSAVR